MTHRGDEPGAHGAIENLVVGLIEIRSTNDRTVVGDVGDDLLSLLGGVAEVLEGTRHRLVDDLHRAAADHLLELDQREVWFDTGGIAVHHEANGASRGKNGRLGIAETIGMPELDDLVPLCLGGGQDSGVIVVQRVNLTVGITMPSHDCLMWLSVFGVSAIGTDDGSQFSGTPVGDASHEGRDGSCEGTSTIRVVTQAQRHEKGAQVGISDTELTEVTCRLTNGLSREVSKANGDIHRGDDEFNSSGEFLDVEMVIFVEELQQVKASQVT